MNNYLFTVKTFHLLRQHQPWKLLLIFGLTLFLGVNSGFSIMLLIPLLQLLNVGNSGPADGPALFFQNWAGSAGINLTIEWILVIYVVILTFNALLDYWKSILDAGYQQTFIYRLRSRLFRKIIMAEWPLLNTKSKTNHLQVLTREVPNLADYYYFYLRMITTPLMTSAFIAYAPLKYLILFPFFRIFAEKKK
jgi:ATP-binding cassette, subfamily C, bacterial